MSKTWIIVIVVGLLVLTGYLLSVRNAMSPSSPTEETITNQAPETNSPSLNQSTQAPMPNGRMVLAVTDAAANMANISEIALSVDKVEVESATNGWMTVSQTSHQYNLLALKNSGNLQVLLDFDLEEGQYNQVRLTVSNVVVIEKGGATKQAKLPSGELKIVGGFMEQESKTTAITFDFLADKSLHVTGRGEYIFAPVVKMEAKDDAQATVDANGRVVIVGGTLAVSTTAGMDVDGSVKVNFVLPSTATLELVGNVIRIKAKGETDAGLAISAQQAVSLVTDGNYVDAVISLQLETSGGAKVWRVSGIKNLLPVVVTVDAQSGAIISVQ